MKRSASLPAEKLDMLRQSPARLAGKAGSCQASPMTSPRAKRACSPVNDNASTGSSSVAEDLSVRTPLLELDTPTTVKTNTSIKVLCMRVCVCLFIFLCVCLLACMCMFVCVFACLNVCLFVGLFVCMYVSLLAHIC